MSGTGGKCPACGENAVIKDDKEGQFVCEECGVVVESGILVNSLGFSESAGPSGNHNSLPTEYYNRNSQSMLKPLRFASRRVKEVGQALKFTPPMIEEATFLFKDVYYAKSIFNQSLNVKETVAISCVYIIGRQYGWPLAKTTMSGIGQKTIGEIVHWTNIVTELKDITITAPDVEELIPAQLSRWDLPQSIEVNAVKILQMVKSTWVSAGKNRLSVVQAAIYIAYEAERCKKEKKGPLNFKVFCKEVNDKYIPSGSCWKLVKSIKTVLCRLGAEIPWIGSSCTASNLPCHLGDILQYQKTLLYDILKQHRTDEKDSSDSNSAENDPNEPAQEESDVEDSDMDVPSRTSDMIKRVSSPERKKRKMSADIFTPSCYRENRQKSREDPKTDDPSALEVNYPGDMDSCELNDFDISESEFRQYIRTKQEIKLVTEIADAKTASK